METDDRDVLQENQVHGHLLDLACSEADDERAALPGDALERICAMLAFPVHATGIPGCCYGFLDAQQANAPVMSPTGS